MSRRRFIQAAEMAAIAALTAGWALSGAGVALAASPSPSPSASGEASDATGGGAADPELATFGLAAASSDRPDPRSWIAVTAAPGSVIYDHVAVINQSNTPLDLDVYTADAANTADGSLGLPDRTVKPTDAGSWVAVDAAMVNVPPQSSAGIGYVVVPVTITIPADAEPGEHVAGVVASLTAEGATTGGDQSATVNLEQRVGLRVYVNVDGPVHAGLTITDVSARYHDADVLGLAIPGSATVTYTLTNTGNTRLAVKATTTATGLFGLVKASASGGQIDELLPKASVTQTVELPRVWPAAIDRVTVAAAVTAPIAGGDPGIGTPTATVWMWAVPWAYLAIVVLVALVWWLLRRRAKTARRGRHSDSGSVTPSAGDIRPEQSSTKEAVSSHIPSAS